LEKFANTGAEIGRTAARIGVGTSALQEIGHAAYLAGGQANTGAMALETLGSKLHGAAWGRDSEAIAVFKEFGINVRDATGQIRTADAALPEIADKIKSLKDPYQQTALAQALFGDAGIRMLPWLRKGAEGIREYREEVRKYGADVSDYGLKAANDFEEAQRRLELVTLGLGNTLAETFLPKLTPVIAKTTDWLNELRKSPDAMKAVEIGAGVLATAIGVTLVASVGSLMAKVLAFNAVWLTSPIGRAIAILTTLEGTGVFTAPIPHIATPEEEAEIQRKKAEETDAIGREHGNKPDWLQRQFNWGMDWLTGTKPKPSGADLARPSPNGLAAAGGAGDNINTSIDFFTRKGLTREQATGVVARLAEESGGGKQLDPNAVNPSSGAYGIGQWLGNRKPGALATGGDLNKQLELVWSEFQTTEAAAFRKIQAARTAGDAATAMEAFERAGNPSFTQRAASTANRLFGIGNANAEIARSPFQPEARAGFSDAQLRGQFADYQKMMVGSKLSGGTFEQWREMMYPGGASPSAPPANTEPATGPRFLPDVPDYSGALDSNHRVSIDINGMPQGGRARLLESSGPAKLQLRVQQAMSSP
jgi:Phage tail lysozyme/Phage-related minor tail protein